MKIVVGLGNPGIEYQRTRHNVGFDGIDRLARRVSDPTQSAKARFQALSFEGESGGEKVLLLKPMTYMNLSGTTVAEAMRFYKLDATRDLLVLVDDIALPCGAIRLRAEGSSGGHNGLSDIEAKLGTNRYARCRIGIDAPGQIPQRDYVLGRFRPEQQPLVDEAIGLAAEAAEAWIRGGITEAMNRFNSRSGDGARSDNARKDSSKTEKGVRSDGAERKPAPSTDGRERPINPNAAN